ncbi:MAG: DUF790 family protein [Deltaproteobacteria bacterium]|nr:MAG: DUF790 family protein [Deltaproteobacteria bacterium]
MLTGDLVRATVRSGRVYPGFVDPEDGGLLGDAGEVLAIFGEHVGERREVLEESLRGWVGDARGFQTLRGLAKLVEDRSTFETRAAMDPVALRRALFEAAAEVHPVRRERDALHEVTREDVVRRVGAAHGLAVEEVEETLYADLRGEERLTGVRSVSPEELLRRYNAGLVQALLLRSAGLEATVRAGSPGALRGVFRALKFRQLMFRAWPMDGEGSWRLVVDGPMSLFQQTQRYGLQLALFFPVLLHMESWSLEADVTWGRRRESRRLSLSGETRLRPWGRMKGTWRSREQALLEERLAGHASGWLARPGATVVDLGGEDVLVPDLELECPSTGRVALVDIFGFWRRDYLARRMASLSRHGPANLVLCVSRRLAGARESLGALGENVVEFAEVIPLGALLKVVERVAVVPAGASQGS